MGVPSSVVDSVQFDMRHPAPLETCELQDSVIVSR